MCFGLKTIIQIAADIIYRDKILLSLQLQGSKLTTQRHAINYQTHLGSRGRSMPFEWFDIWNIPIAD
ncbi:hypothetical protein ACJX0J_026549, partial [Zea mays]